MGAHSISGGAAAVRIAVLRSPLADGLGLLSTQAGATVFPGLILRRAQRRSVGAWAKRTTFA